MIRSARRLFRDSAIAGVTLVTLSLLASAALGQLEIANVVIGVIAAFFLISLLLNYSLLLEIRDKIETVQIAHVNEEVAKDVRVISMEDFISQETRLKNGDSVLLFLSTLDYDRKYFIDTIANNLNRGIRYYYLMGGAEAKRDWDLFLEDLEERGATKLPEGKFNTPGVAPLLWTTAIYEFKDPNKELHAISILEHIYDSSACIELSELIAKRMKEHFWKLWQSLEEN